MNDYRGIFDAHTTWPKSEPFPTDSQRALVLKMQSGVTLTVRRSDKKWFIEGLCPELECSLSDESDVKREDVCILLYNGCLTWPESVGDYLHFEPMIATLTEKGKEPL